MRPPPPPSLRSLVNGSRVGHLQTSKAIMIRTARAIFFALLTAMCSAPAFASFPPYQPITGYVIGQDGNIVYPSAGAACTASAGSENTGTLTTTFAFPHFIQLSRHCDVIRNSDGQNLGQVGIFYRLGPAACPPGSTSANGQCTCTAPSVQTPGTAGPSCEAAPNPCTANAGKIKTINRTEGWFRSPSASDNKALPGGPAPGPTVMTDGQCKVVVVESGECFRSQVPTSQGLYRRSCDYRVIQTDQPLIPQPGEPTNPGEPDPVCPGAIGEVNGVLGCYGTATGPIPTTPRPAPAPEVPGNPAAGEKPSSGPGAGSGGEGRTPMVGTGGNAGGPSTSAIDVRGTGRIPSPADGTEQLECGAPGQPKCGIDETGTPDGSDAMTGKLGEFEQKLGERESALSTVTSASGKDTSWGVMPKWTEQGTCSVWNIFTLPAALGSRAVSLDLCPVMPYAHGVANFIWVALAFFGITSMVFAAMTSKGT